MTRMNVNNAMKPKLHYFNLELVNTYVHENGREKQKGNNSNFPLTTTKSQ
jgi:hypothetical protein